MRLKDFLVRTNTRHASELWPWQGQNSLFIQRRILTTKSCTNSIANSRAGQNSQRVSICRAPIITLRDQSSLRPGPLPGASQYNSGRYPLLQHKL
jgi:hypothetical protein